MFQGGENWSGDFLMALLDSLDGFVGLLAALDGSGKWLG
ncbi:hypothetical protein DSUL_60182 [Desulfovibrionales bacterium]